MPTSVSPKRSISLPAKIFLLTFAELVLLFLALSIGSLMAKAVLITIAIALALLHINKSTSS